LILPCALVVLTEHHNFEITVVSAIKFKRKNQSLVMMAKKTKVVSGHPNEGGGVFRKRSSLLGGGQQETKVGGGGKGNADRWSVGFVIFSSKSLEKTMG
jgi:hypothetical protein